MIAFDFDQSIILENTAVRLRAIELGDIDHLLQFSIDEPEIWTYSLVPAHGEKNLKAYVEAALLARKERKSYAFIVYDKLKEKYAGSTRYYDMQLADHCLQLGYTWYGKDFQGTLLNKNCKFLMLEYAFDVLGMKRVEFRADNNNVRSIAAMKSIGCTVEGVLRSNCFKQDGSRRDSIVLSILQSEWNEGIKRDLLQKIS